MKRNLLAILLVLSLAFSLTACGSGTNKGNETNLNSNESQDNLAEITPAGEAVDTPPIENTVQKILPNKDRVGNDITVPEEVNSIISLAPSTTEILYDLGVNDKLVAVDTQSPLYAKIPDNVKQFDLMAPDIEQIVALEPDIVFVTSMSNYSGEDIFSSVRAIGICVVEIPTSNSIEGIKEDIQFISDCVDKSEEGKTIIEEMQATIDKIAAIGNGITDKKTIFFEIGSAPDLYSFGAGVFLNEMIELIGATNVLEDQESWLAVTEEAAILANPDVILTNVNYIENPTDEIKSRIGWENVTAVANNQVFYIDNGASNLPNHNIVKALIEMAKAVYPDAFAQLN